MTTLEQAQTITTMQNSASLKRLSNQLRVDFAADVHGSGGKRKREPTRSIYEEAAKEQMACGKKGKSSKGVKKSSTIPRTKSTHNETTAISEVGDQDSYDDDTHELMLRAASSLAQLSAGYTNGTNDANEKETEIASVVDTIMKAHADALAAKDEAIQAATVALAAKEELVKAQSAIIAMLQSRLLSDQHTRGRIE
jgi:hypothetical protein